MISVQWTPPATKGRKTTVGTRQRRKTARRAFRDYKSCVRQLEALQWELGPPRREWVERNALGQIEEIVESPGSPLSWPLLLVLQLEDRRGLRTSQRTIRRYDKLLKRAHDLTLKAVGSLERLRRVMRSGETVRDVLRGRKVRVRS